ncbi:MAG TPA: hypothetical protein ENK50_11265 [Sedimenticola sp.]|nr:hypothetical protein [Sedimenticola sp.]
MFGTASLSLEQAPPISIPFRFFLTAPLFALAAALVALAAGPDLLQSRWSLPTLAFTHLLTLGFLAMVMGGAMTQILPVVAGSPVPAVIWTGTLFHLLLTLGVMALGAAFLLGEPSLMILALVLLGTGFGVFLTAFAVALLRVRNPSPTVTGMWLALGSLLLTVTLGTLLGVGLFSLAGVGRLLELTDLHLGWGLLGWVGLLLLAVSYQVVPMFQVTPEYPRWMRQGVAWGIVGGLLLWSVARLGEWGEGVTAAVMSVVLLLFASFSVVTLRLQARRKRRIGDVTLLFWRTGLVSLLLVIAIWAVARMGAPLSASPRYSLLLGVLALPGAGMSLVNGMLYKIVPFLSWFHLQNRQLALMCLTVPVPNMKELVPDRRAHLQFRLHLLSLLLAAAAVFLPVWLVRPAALVFAGSNLLLFWNLLSAVRLYRATDRQLREAPAG